MTPEEAELELAEAEAAAAKKSTTPRPAPAPSEPAALSPKSMSGTALRGFGQGASGFFSDELAGVSGALQELGSRGPLAAGAAAALAPVSGATALASAANAPLVGAAQGERPDLPVMEAMLQRFRADRDRARREQDVGRKVNPKTALASELAGAVAMPGPKVSRIGGAPLTRAGSMAATGALQGAQAGAGASRSESAGGVLEDALAMGALGGVANPVMGGLVRGAGVALEKTGVSQALKALGARAGISDSLSRAGIETAEEGQALAKRALDEGLIRPGRTAEDVAKQALEKQQFGANPVIEDVMTRANQGTPFDFEEAGWTSADRLMSRKRSVPGPLNPQEQKTGAEAMRMVKRISETQPAEGAGSFSEANRLKQDLYDAINWKSDAPLSTEMQRKAAGGLRQSIEDQAARSLGPEDAAALKAANERWGFAQTVKEIATDEAKRQSQRQFPWLKSLGGAVAMGGAGATQSPAMALGGAALGALAGSPRATSAAAVGAYGAGKALKGGLGEAIGGAPGRSVADPMGPLRQYLGLSTDEQKDASAQALKESP